MNSVQPKVQFDFNLHKPLDAGVCRPATQTHTQIQLILRNLSHISTHRATKILHAVRDKRTNLRVFIKCVYCIQSETRELSKPEFSLRLCRNFFSNVKLRPRNIPNMLGVVCECT